LDEQRLLQHYGLAVHLHAHLTSIMQGTNGQGCGYYIAPYAKLNRKKVPMSSTFLWKLCAGKKKAAAFNQRNIGNADGALRGASL
jgi:hypothetical protein